MIRRFADHAEHEALVSTPTPLERNLSAKSSLTDMRNSKISSCGWARTINLHFRGVLLYHAPKHFELHRNLKSYDLTMASWYARSFSM